MYFIKQRWKLTSAVNSVKTKVRNQDIFTGHGPVKRTKHMTITYRHTEMAFQMQSETVWCSLTAGILENTNTS